jgi:hypothetical protein
VNVSRLTDWRSAPADLHRASSHGHPHGDATEERFTLARLAQRLRRASQRRERAASRARGACRRSRVEACTEHALSAFTQRRAELVDAFTGHDMPACRLTESQHERTARRRGLAGCQRLLEITCGVVAGLHEIGITCATEAVKLRQIVRQRAECPRRALRRRREDSYGKGECEGDALHDTKAYGRHPRVIRASFGQRVLLRYRS